MLDKLPSCDRDLTNLNRILVITLHLACLLTREMPEVDSEEHENLHRALYELVKINVKDKWVRIVIKKKKKLC